MPDISTDTLPLVPKINDTLLRELTQLSDAFLAQNYDVGAIVQKQSEDEYSWSVQFMGPHLRYKLVIFLRKDEESRYCLDYVLYSLLGHLWEFMEVPRFDTIIPFDETSSLEHIEARIKDLELNMIPSYVLAGSLIK